MDVFAHGIWTYAIVQVRRKLWRWKLLVFLAILPDLVWLPATAWILITTGAIIISQSLYNPSHSLVVWLAFTILVSIFTRKQLFSLTWPWALHIAVDIPGHQHLLTPFLWPISDFTIRGWWEWLSWPWLLGNWAVLGSVFWIMRLKNGAV